MIFLDISWEDAKKSVSVPSLHLCLGGPATVRSYLGEQTWETLENLIKI